MTIRAYIVGGAVRDRLLREAGYEAATQDRDWVVVGATPEEMVQAGYEPVGADFPVFLHPRTHEEYALARTERKSAPGYHGFVFHASPDVTLEEDLRRRDLTINAMAMMEDGTIVDPYGGQNDLRDRVLRHVSEAFCEDPVRILRVARFAARFADFSLCPRTAELMRRMVQAGEADALVPERVMAEISKGLAADRPSRMLVVLSGCGALERICPGVCAGSEQCAALDRASALGISPSARAAVFFLSAGPRAQALCRALRASADAIAMTGLLVRLLPRLRQARSCAERVGAMHEADAWRRPQRFGELLDAWRAVDGACVDPWQRDLRAALAVNAGQVAASCGDKRQIAARVLQARIQAAELTQAGKSA